MGELLNNQVIDTVKYMYLNELKNKYNRFLGVTCCDILEYLHSQYEKIRTVDLDANNKWMNEAIDVSLLLEK